MKPSCCLLLLLGCSGKSSGQATESGSQTWIEAHNAVRADVSPAASPPLDPLTWDGDLATIATDWAENCVFEHSSAPAPGANYGENLAYFSGDTSTEQDVVAAWAEEVADYSYEDNSCAADRLCGHYTQLVWRDTERVGCGVAECDMLGTKGLFWVCNYDPPGNWVGEWPY